MKNPIVLVLLLMITLRSYSQTEDTGWIFLSHAQKLSDKFDLRADLQARSSHKLDYLSALLLRSALSYNLTEKNSVAIGYAFFGQWDEKDGEKLYSPEHRIYQQYLYSFKAGKNELNVRFRLEQRFVREEDDINFSQRARAFLSSQIPISANSDFTKGMYAGLQNEIFLTIQNKEKVNGSIFDQNRSFASVGYRWSKKIDTEFGYMYWIQKEKDMSVRRNVWQLMITTNL
ncbi:DUF2490 domain-containing protein [Pedobacter chinensis]|uniref:DUF2490 domain-containing protein n=1 Tax=Pedobacter chinensis TaxID=2282421 RepID=A0A369Q012_9SPHI|nr:DUF2490 domain-containing protein [Pedobacter chinensis]RDC56279.1 DUF2490 domain-containing protein [Pedobacter chinensis]